jgi:long-chain acyl-CoA synthetase
LVVPEIEFCKEWCKRKGINCQSYADMANNDQVKQRIWEEIEGINQQFGKYEQVKKIELCTSPWTIDTGELTPSLKLKRKVILQKYQGLFEKIYS